MPTSRPFVPFIRWANTVRIPRGGHGALNRRLYDHELVYVLEGQGNIILDGQTHPANPDHLFLVQPGIYHSFLSPDESQRLLGIHFDFEPHDDTLTFTEFESAPDVLNRSRLRPRREIEGWHLAERPFLDLTGHPRVRRQLEELVAEYGRHDQQSRFIAGAQLLAIFGQIERELTLMGEVARHQRVGADAVRRVQRAREQLERELESPPTIEAVAAQVGWSGDHLRRMFRAVLD
ncbi:AraC family transcriptional regulator, partial [bacterium]